MAMDRQSFRDLVLDLQKQEQLIQLGGGIKAQERQHVKKRLTARERLTKLLDSGSSFLELGLWAGFGMYEDWVRHRRPVS